jgi:predicted methyltransferase
VASVFTFRVLKDIISLGERTVMRDHFTGEFGLTLTDQYRMEWLFITKMGIGVTAKYPT